MTRSRRWGLGPVFAYEWLTGARRWQMYALRALYVAMLLLCLAAVWVPFEGQVLSIGLTASLSELFFRRLGMLQLMLVMLAAPAVMAGSICVEKSRGTLLHLLVTDLTDDEIVLGKLAARLTPVLMVLASVVPVLALVGLLGGIDPGALLGTFLVTVGAGSVGCALALVLSIWVRQAYQALLLTYLVEGLLLVGPAPLEWLVTPAAT
jgi:ABC-type transport system involved in multi-copper enzyme maturation permease subunit